jgi:Fe-S oxidoreductase
VPILVGLRRGAVNTGAWQNPHGSKLFLALEKGSNALGLSSTERDKFVEKNALPIFDGTQEYCLWLGCMGAYDPRGREIVLALVRIMRHLGVTLGVLRKEKCTGDPVRRLGNDLLFRQLAEANLEALAQFKTQKILSICPHCVRTIQEDWKEFGTPPEVEHHSEFLARHLAELNLVSGHDSGDYGKTSFGGGFVSGHDFSRAENPAKTTGALAPERLSSAPEKIVFHDPCYLGRYRNIYDQPRQVAALSGELVEAPRSRERSFCCGAGGGLAFLGEEKGERVSHVRAAELAATGAGVIAAACPFCNTMFRDALAARGEDAPKLMDIAQLVARGLPENKE